MKRPIFSIFLLVLAALPAFSQGMVWTKHYQDYFDQYQDVAVSQMDKYKIPASITLAQGVLESAAGRSELANKGNNHFGIKCAGWTGRRTYHDDDAQGECFRAYDNPYESYEDHSVFLTTSKRYQQLFQLPLTDYKGWARGLKACGYATSPTYASKLIEIIELYGLYRLDAKDGSRVAPPSTASSPSPQPTGRPADYRGGLRQVYFFNRNYYVIARRGDTFRALAEETGVPRGRLASYNERGKDDVLEAGEIVWLQKKRPNVPKDYQRQVHVVAAGESMYTISQRYGIRLKHLYKMNGLPADYQPYTGDRLMLR